MYYCSKQHVPLLIKLSVDFACQLQIWLEFQASHLGYGDLIPTHNTRSRIVCQNYTIEHWCVHVPMTIPQSVCGENCWKKYLLSKLLIH